MCSGKNIVGPGLLEHPGSVGKPAAFFMPLGSCFSSVYKRVERDLFLGVGEGVREREIGIYTSSSHQ